MRDIEFISQFKKDYKKAQKNPSNNNLDSILNPVLELLMKDENLTAKFRTHKLIGEYKGYEECHLKPDLLLIYLRIDNKLILVRLGSHSELFS